eukprot:scaffold21785_cov46-Cyclotella_meneghiniana.AAC.1
MRRIRRITSRKATISREDENGRFDAIRRPLMAGLRPHCDVVVPGSIGRSCSNGRTAPASEMAVLSAPSFNYCDDLPRRGNVCKRNTSYDQRT